jgi:uncharacterized protein (TIGR00297 family)
MIYLRGELWRKALHVGVGGGALLLRVLTPAQAALAACLALGFNLFVLDRVTRRALLRPQEIARGYSFGIALYPAAVLALIIVFRHRLELAAATWGLLAFGDGMAGAVGAALGGPKLSWNPAKTWAGFAAFVLWGTAAAAFLIRFTQRGALDAPKTWIGPSFLAVGSVGPHFEPTFLLAGCFAAATFAAFAESLPTKLDDNFLVPLVGGAALYAATLVEPQLLVAQLPALLRDTAAGAAVCAALAVTAYAGRAVDRSGALYGFCLGVAIYACSGWRGFSALLLFFVLGTACTKIGYAKKEMLGIAQAKGGRRGAKHALANAGAGVLFAFLAIATPYHMAFTLALVAAFATAAADTVSSEIGQAYGRTAYLVTTMKHVPPGTEGAVSLEGTLAGIAASTVPAAVAAATSLITWPGAAAVVAAALIGTTVESFLGATLERINAIDNEVVNFANTLVGGLAAMGIWALL